MLSLEQKHELDGCLIKINGNYFMILSVWNDAAKKHEDGLIADIKVEYSIEDKSV